MSQLIKFQHKKGKLTLQNVRILQQYVTATRFSDISRARIEKSTTNECWFIIYCLARELLLLHAPGSVRHLLMFILWGGSFKVTAVNVTVFPWSSCIVFEYFKSCALQIISHVSFSHYIWHHLLCGISSILQLLKWSSSSIEPSNNLMAVIFLFQSGLSTALIHIKKKFRMCGLYWEFLLL